MKKLFAFSAVLFLFSIMTWSQTGRGSFYISGITNMTFSRTVTSADVSGSPVFPMPEINSFTLQSEFGVFILKDLALGLVVDYRFNKEFLTGTPDISKETLIMPSLTYVIPLNSKLRPYLQVGGGLANLKQGESNDEDSFMGYALAGVAGVKYFISESLALDLGIQISSASVTSDNLDMRVVNDNLGVGLGLSLYF